MRLNKLEIPVMIGKRFMKILRINAGPVFSYILSQNIGQSGTKEAWNEINAEYKNATVGLQYGIGLDIAMITVDLRYEMGLQSITDGITIGENTFNADQRLNQFLLSCRNKILSHKTKTILNYLLMSINIVILMTIYVP